LLDARREGPNEKGESRLLKAVSPGFTCGAPPHDPVAFVFEPAEVGAGLLGDIGRDPGRLGQDLAVDPVGVLGLAELFITDSQRSRVRQRPPGPLGPDRALLVQRDGAFKIPLTDS